MALGQPLVSEIVMIVKRSTENQWMSAGFPDAERAILHLNKLEGRTSIVRMKAGARGPMHTHEGAEHAYVLSGKVDVGGNVLSAGDYLYTEAGEIHALVALEDSVIFASTERAIRVIEDKAAA
jgi:quercetin dioxygenase-like cupin family protein